MRKSSTRGPARVSKPSRALIDRIEARTTEDGDLSSSGPHATVRDPGLFKRGEPLATRTLVWESIKQQHRAQSGRIQQDGNAVVLMAGPPGVGKSTTLQRKMPPASLVIDPDDIKQLLIRDGITNGLWGSLLTTDHLVDEPVTPAELSGLVHSESVMIAEQMFADALLLGDNVVLCGTLSWMPYAEALLAQIEDSGYEHLSILDVEAPKKVVLTRVLQRWWTGRQERIQRSIGQGGRYIPIEVINNLFPEGPSRWSTSEKNARLLYELALASGQIDEASLDYTLVDTKGRTPITPLSLVGTRTLSPPLSTCRRCHRRLTHARSRSLGLGPSCRTLA